MPFLHHITGDGILSYVQIQKALQLVIRKHQSLRTSLIYNSKENILMQIVIECNDDDKSLFTLVQNVYETDQEIDNIMEDERGNSNYFNLSQGLVFRCHILRYKKNPCDGFLRERDAIIFNFHHALFDFSSLDLFYYDLNQAYNNDRLTDYDDTTLRYIDCKSNFIF